MSLITNMKDEIMTTKTRSGSFPCMNLADDLGVAYADVLIMVDCRDYRRIPASATRVMQKAGVEKVHGAILAIRKNGGYAHRHPAIDR